MFSYKCLLVEWPKRKLESFFITSTVVISKVVISIVIVSSKMVYMAKKLKNNRFCKFCIKILTELEEE
jgi:hypothetical protein